jgi:hypothetical protein
VKVNDGFVGGHQLNYNHIYDVCRETTDMGAVNLHNRDRFYVPFDSPVWNKPNDHGPFPANSHFPRQGGHAVVRLIDRMIGYKCCDESAVISPSGSE